MKVLVTGITGFVGSHIADYILERHPECVVAGTRRWHHSRREHVRHMESKVEWHDCDLTDPVQTMEMVKAAKPDWVFHCAAESFVSPSWGHPHSYMNGNYHATVNLLEALVRQEIHARVHIPGSGEEYGDIHENELPITELTPLRPVNPYAVTKIAQDLIGYVYHRSYGLEVVRTRAFNHEGPRRDHVFGIPWYAYQIARIEKGLQEPVVKVGHLDDRRNFTHVIDMVEAYWMAMENCEPGELYLVGNENPESVYSFREALEWLMRMSSVKGLRYETAPEFVRPTCVPRLIGDITKFQAATGWKPKISFEEILSSTLDYWRERV
ncbi:MAG: GDP-mannose 4,6-dehydratase [Verrucomicrobiae bacterium]